jgi:tetratricopeptide (TPR) repeat protein
MRTLNLRFAAILLTLLILVGIGLFFLHQYQYKHIADDIVAQARAARVAGDNDSAVRLAYHFLEFRPDDAALLEELAGWLEEKAVGRKQIINVAALVDRALQITPDRSDLRRRLVKMNLKIGRWGECLDHIDRLMPQFPDDPELLSALGSCKEAIGKPSEAAAAFEKAWKLDPKRVATALDYAMLLGRHLGRPEEAGRILEQAVQTNPDNSEVRLGLARFYRATGKHADAEAAATEAIKLAPKDVATLTTAAEIYQSAGKIALARTTLQQAAELSPADNRVACSLAWLLLYDGKTEEAIERLSTAIREQAGNADVLTLLGDILALDGRIDALEKIVNDLQRIRRSAPERGWNADYLHARLTMRRGDWKRAAELLEQLRLGSAKNAGLNKQANYLLALCYDQLFDRSKELESYRRILEADSQAGYFRLEYARSLSRSGQFAESVKELRAAIQRPDLPPRTVFEVVNEIVDRAQRGGAAYAIKEFEKALEPIKVEDPAFYQVLAKVELFRLLYRTTDAFKLASQYLAKHPNQVAMVLAKVRLLDQIYGPDRAETALAEAEKRLGDQADFRLARIRLTAIRYEPSRRDVLFALANGLEKFNPEDRTAVLSELLLACQSSGDSEATGRALELLRAARPDHVISRFLLMARTDPEKRGSESYSQLSNEMAAIEGTKDGFMNGLQLVHQAVITANMNPPAAAQAIQYLDQLAKLNPGHPIIAFFRGRLAELADQTVQALEYYQASLANNLLDQPIDEEFRLLLRMNPNDRRCRVLIEQSSLSDRLRFDADRFIIATVLQMPAASARSGIAERILRANPTATPAQLAWFANECQRNGLSRHAALALARATNLAPLSDEAWSARIAFYAQKQDIHQIQELIVEAKRQIPANESAIILTRSLDRAGLPNEVRNALYQSVGTMPAETISRESIQKLLQFGRIDEARRQLQTMIDSGNPDDLSWARRTLAVNLTIAPSLEAFQRSLRLLEANKSGNVLGDDDLRALAHVYAVQKHRMLDNVSARQRAIQLYSELAQRPSRQPEDFIQLARLHRADVNQSAYQLTMNQLMQAFSRHPVALNFVAGEALQFGDLAAADSAITNSETIEQKCFETLVLRCCHLTLAGKGSEAVARLNKFIMDAPAGNSRAACQLRCGHAVWEILNSYPIPAQSESPITLRDAAIQWYQAGLGRDPNALLRLVVLMCKAGRMNEAVEMVQTTKVRQSFSAETCLAATVVALRNGQPTPTQIQSVERQVSELLRQNSNSTALLLVQADLYDLQKRYGEAVSLYRAVLDREPNNVVALNNLAWTLGYDPVKIGDALRLIQDAIDRTGPLNDLLDTRARILFAAGRREEAFRDLTDAAVTAPSATRYFYLAVMHRQAEQPAQADAALQRARQFGLTAADVHPRDAQWYRELCAN